MRRLYAYAAKKSNLSLLERNPCRRCLVATTQRLRILLAVQVYRILKHSIYKSFPITFPKVFAVYCLANNALYCNVNCEIVWSWPQIQPCKDCSCHDNEACSVDNTGVTHVLVAAFHNATPFKLFAFLVWTAFRVVTLLDKLCYLYSLVVLFYPPGNLFLRTHISIVWTYHSFDLIIAVLPRFVRVTMVAGQRALFFVICQEMQIFLNLHLLYLNRSP